ncbi:MAG: alpha/beta hydrolase [Verrucomicrobiota bacterium]
MITKAFITLAFLLIIYLGFNSYAFAFSDRILFPHVPPSYVKTEAIFFLQSRDGEQIAATYLPAKHSEQLLLYSHGNGEDIGHGLPLYQAFQSKGLSVLAYDYPGYGLSSGRASEKGVYASIEAAYRYARGELGYDASQIILYGRSVGSGPTCWMAEQETFAGIILDGAFTSAFRVVTGRKIVPWDKFDNLKRLHSIRSPVLLIHGTKDNVVPFSHAQKNYAAIQSPKQKLWIEGAKHNDHIRIAGERYWNTVMTFTKALKASDQ